jgi:hypothetical protein
MVTSCAWGEDSTTGWSLSLRWFMGGWFMGEWLILVVGEEDNIGLRQGTESWSAGGSRVETGLEAV